MYQTNLDNSQTSYSKVLSRDRVKLNLKHIKACAVPCQHCHAVHSRTCKSGTSSKHHADTDQTKDRELIQAELQQLKTTHRWSN